ncbi:MULTISPECIES: hypothetical protein [Persephonella]|nr:MULTISPECIES: hypothetical protein [Persephonella]
MIIIFEFFEKTILKYSLLQSKGTLFIKNPTAITIRNHIKKP